MCNTSGARFPVLIVGARDRAQAVHYAYQHGLVAPRPE